MNLKLLRAPLAIGLINVVLASVNADEQDTAKQMNGYWKLREYQETGHSGEEMLNQNCRLAIKDGVEEAFKNGKSFGKSKFTISGENFPQQIDFVNERGEKTLGIITMHSDMYIAILSDPEKRKTDRPANFLPEDGALVTVYERMTEQEWKRERQQSLTRDLGDTHYFLKVLPAEQLERDKPFQKSVQLRKVEAAVLLVPIQVPIAIDHRIEIVKCTSSDKAIIVPIDVVQGAPGLRGDQEVQSVTLLLRVLRRGNATIDVDITYNANKSPGIKYDFTFID